MLNKIRILILWIAERIPWKDVEHFNIRRAKVNIIFNDSNTNLGGIEILFLEMTHYLVNHNHKVFFLVKDNSIYESKLADCPHVTFIKKKYQKPVELYSNQEIIREKEHVLSQLPTTEKFQVISPYYNSLQYAIAVFGEKERFQLMHLWSHPQSWANSLSLKKQNSFIKIKNKNKKYFYQKNLIEHLEKKRADYYSARAIPVFNSWFYEISLDIPKIETLPIENVSQELQKIRLRNDSKKLSIIWCGRFTYFKNEAIVHIHQTLEKLAKQYPELKINYGIVGFGDKKSTEYLKKTIKSDKVNVNFLGKVEPKNLVKIFHEYDVGVGMGLTVKKMGQVGLPAIVIDSFEDDTLHEKNCNWLFDTHEGDAGDGYYFRLAGKEIENRKVLYDLLSEVATNPKRLEQYSKRCIEYVNTYYSAERQIKKILFTAKNSQFAGENYPVFRKNIGIRLVLSIVHKMYVGIKNKN